MRGSSSFPLIHVMTDRFSDPLVVDQEGTSSTSTKWDPSSSAASSACALFGGRSLTAHLGELLAGGGQVRPPVDEGPGRPGGRREGGRGSRILARAAAAHHAAAHRSSRPSRPIHAPGPAARTGHRPKFQDSTLSDSWPPKRVISANQVFLTCT